LNTENRGRYLGSFNTDDTILVIFKDGSYELTSVDITNHCDVANIEILHKFDPERVISVVHMDGESKIYYVKRFKIETTTIGKRFSFINESKGSKMVAVSTHEAPQVEIKMQREKKGEKETESILLSAFIDVKGWKATGNKLNYYKVNDVEVKTPESIVEEPKAGSKAGKLTRMPKPVEVSLPSEKSKELGLKKEELAFELINSEDVKTGIKEEAKPKKKQLNLF